MNPWTEIRCPGRCEHVVRFDQGTLILAPHPLYPASRFSSRITAAPCDKSGQRLDPGRLPGWHPQHECGSYCGGVDAGIDGQMVLFSRCQRERQAGPPSAVDTLGDLA